MIEAIQCWYNFSVSRRFMYFIAVRFYKLICHTIIFRFGRISSSKRQKPSTLFYMKEFRAVKEDINFCKLVSDGHCTFSSLYSKYFEINSKLKEQDYCLDNSERIIWTELNIRKGEQQFHFILNFFNLLMVWILGNFYRRRVFFISFRY